jgi:hypothetical protein
VPIPDLAGKRLYKPELILLNFVLGGLPVGCFAYGVNISRRGQKLIGVLQIASGAYKRAIAQGALPEKWWPPLVAALSILLLVAILFTFVAPTSMAP